MKNIYISDLDGTLLRNNATLHPDARRILVRMLNGDLNFTVASARSVVSMQQIIGNIPFRIPVVEFNGAFVTDYQTREHLIAHDLQPEVKSALLDFLRTRNSPPFISSFNGREDCLYYDHIANGGMAWYRDDRKRTGDPRLRSISKLDDALNDQVVCFTVIQDGATNPGLERDLRETFGEAISIYNFENQYSPGWFWLTIHDPRATKARGIRALLDLCQLPAGQLTVFGDNLNDLPMFEFAARAIAVENAQEAVKRRADLIIGPNEEDSVVHFIAEENPDLLPLTGHNAKSNPPFTKGGQGDSDAL